MSPYREAPGPHTVARLTGAIVLLCYLASTPSPAQEGQDSFFDQEDFNTCTGFLAARHKAESPEARRYVDWADGYLTAAAEDGKLRHYAGRPDTPAKAFKWLTEFCQDRPVESFYGAVAALVEAWRRPAAP